MHSSEALAQAYANTCRKNTPYGAHLLIHVIRKMNSASIPDERRVALMLRCHAVGGRRAASSRPMSAGEATRAPLPRSEKSIAKPSPADYPKILPKTSFWVLQAGNAVLGDCAAWTGARVGRLGEASLLLGRARGCAPPGAAETAALHAAVIGCTM